MFRMLFCFVLVWFCYGDLAMAAGGGGGNSRELDKTPTWAVAGVCTIIILLSIIWEKVLHKLGAWFLDRQKNALYDALEKVKAELMILGFISLLLTFGQSYIARICIPGNVADRMLPCSLNATNDAPSDKNGNHRRLLWYEHRYLAADSPPPPCKEGHTPLISVNGLHQLHILIFFLAVFHLLYSAITMMLGRLKIRGWKKWEEETSTHDYEFSNDPSRFRLTHETSFVKAHTSFWTRIPVFFYVGCFFRQFFQSLSKADYMTLRNGFISVHLAPGSKFNFQKYIKRSLEDDFKVVVGVSPVLWASFVVFLLVNVNGWQALFWASLIPVTAILLVGTKLQAILTKMALEIKDRHAVVQGIPLVQGSNKYFWFGQPQLILHLIHFALFQNAFQITYFLWIWYSFGLKSCFHANFKLAIAKVALGVGVLCLCSYITLPLYALVTQMGSSMKKAIFDEQTTKALKKWRMGVKKRLGEGKSHSPRSLGESVTNSPVHPAAAHALQRFKTIGHSTRSSTYGDEHKTSDFEAEPLTSVPTMMTKVVIAVDAIEQLTEASHPNLEEDTTNEDDFSFVKPSQRK